MFVVCLDWFYRSLSSVGANIRIRVATVNIILGEKLEISYKSLSFAFYSADFEQVHVVLLKPERRTVLAMICPYRSALTACNRLTRSSSSLDRLLFYIFDCPRTDGGMIHGVSRHEFDSKRYILGTLRRKLCLFPLASHESLWWSEKKDEQKCKKQKTGQSFVPASLMRHEKLTPFAKLNHWGRVITITTLMYCDYFLFKYSANGRNHTRSV